MPLSLVPAREAGGTLWVALLGSGPALNLRLTLAVAAGGSLVALALTWIGIRPDR